MTLPTSGSLSLSNVLAELQIANPARALPISLGDPDVLALAGKSALPISLSDLYGKSSQLPLTVDVQTFDGVFSSAFSGGTASAQAFASAAGGSGGYSFTWVVVSSPGGATIGPLDGSAVDISHRFTKLSDGAVTVIFNLTVTDSQGHVVTIPNISITAEWQSNR